MEKNRVSPLVKNPFEFLVVPKCQLLLVLLVIIHCPNVFGFKTEKLTDSFENGQPNDASDALPPHRLIRSVESDSKMIDNFNRTDRLNKSTVDDNLQFSDLVKRMQDLEMQIVDFKNQHIADNRKTSNMMRDLRAQHNRGENLVWQLGEKVVVASEKTENNSQRIDEQEAASKALKDEIADTRKSSSYFRERLDRLENTSSQRFSSEDKKIEDLTNRIDSGKAMINAVIRFAEGNETIGPLPQGSGKGDWKLSGYKSKIIDTYRRTNNHTILYGPSFYTAGIGYKFGTSLEYDGEGLWIGLYVMKGVYDNFIKWPFRGEITYSFVDQHEPPTNTTRNVILIFSSTCERVWTRNFGDRIDPCHWFIGRDKEIKRKGLIRDDSLLVRFEIVSA